MIRVLVLVAHGQIARVATDLFLEKTDAELTLFLCAAPGDPFDFVTTPMGA